MGALLSDVCDGRLVGVSEEVNPMEAIAVLLGGGVLVVGIIGLMLALTIVIPVWETYWLHPLWTAVMVPLGLPQVSFWHLFAINVFICALLIPNHPSARQKDEDENTKAFLTKLSVAFTRPVLAYYVIRWAL